MFEKILWLKLFTPIQWFTIPYKSAVQIFRHEFTGINSFRKARENIGIDQKTVFNKYRARDKTPQTGLGKKLNIIFESSLS
jgi:hypothetical protein